MTSSATVRLYLEVYIIMQCTTWGTIALWPCNTQINADFPKIGYRTKKKDPNRFIYLPISIYLSIYLSIHISIYIPINLPIYLSTYLSIYLFTLSIAGLAFISGRFTWTAGYSTAMVYDSVQPTLHKEFFAWSHCALRRHINILAGPEITKFVNLGRSPEFHWWCLPGV